MGLMSAILAGDRDTPVEIIGRDTSSVVIPTLSIEPETQTEPKMIMVTKTIMVPSRLLPISRGN